MAEVNFSTAPAGGRSIETTTTLTTSAVQISVDQNSTARDCWIDLFVFSNITSGSVTVTVTQNTGSLDFLTTVPIAANSAVEVVIPGGRRFPGGATWLASANSSIIGYVRGLRQQGSLANP